MEQKNGWKWQILSGDVYVSTDSSSYNTTNVLLEWLINAFCRVTVAVNYGIKVLL